MYAYRFDPASGGIVLTSSPDIFSKEPRPVYAAEMDLLGFDNYWNYDKQNDVPYLWAESNIYWYRGVKIAKKEGGDLYTAPKLVPATDDNGNIPFDKQTAYKLLPVDIDAMNDANRDLIAVIEDMTVKKIVRIYEKYKNKLDIFHVAFSGGKDSAVLLSLVKKALPKGSFVVIFGDTCMEFPDTYDAVSETQKQCDKDGTPFYIARSHFDPKTSWQLFGPPARVLRWCCSVHKSTPQTLLMRKLTGKDDYVGLDFVGVRHSESATRSKYDYENYGEKQKGQYSFYPILEWTGAEVWLYIFFHHLYINKAYVKGNPRAGCLLCPMGSGSSDYIRRCNYKENIDTFVDIIKQKNNWDNYSEKELHSYITSGGWINRRSGRGITNNVLKYKENTKNGKISMEVTNPTSDLHEWLKTATNQNLPIHINENKNGSFSVSVNENDVKANPAAGKSLRIALKKTAYCVGCRVCEVNCKGGHLHFKDGKLTITDCVQCHDCHDIPAGCHVYNSLKIPQSEKPMKTINCFDDHAPKDAWLDSFFDLRNAFFTEHTLGPNQFTHFKRFLRDAHLIEPQKNNCTEFSNLIHELGWNTETALGLILVNLAYTNPQFEWYAKQMDIDIPYTSKFLFDTLLLNNVKEKAAKSIIKSYKRIVETSFGTRLNVGYVTESDELVRTQCTINDHRVILYALYRFAEKCALEKEFNLSYLYNETIERDGVSPVRLFGLYDRDGFRAILMGLTAAYPSFIHATFTNDLQTITLRDKTSDDVLALFKEI